METVKNLLISARPQQWYKNLLLVVGIVFSLNLHNVSMLLPVVLAIIYFCGLSAGEYLINDVLDRNRDRKHPVKSQRPIASGNLKVIPALLSASALIVLSLIGAYFTINLGFFLISLSYLLIVLLYSLGFKKFIIVDVLMIASGFVIRAVAGCLAINVFISPWLVTCTFLLALFLALGKRRHESGTLDDKVVYPRTSLSGYSVAMLEKLMSITTGAFIISYMLYTFLTDNYYLMLTTPFVIYGVFRYLFLVHESNFGDKPEMIFKDKAMVINLVVWALLITLILYTT